MLVIEYEAIFMKLLRYAPHLNTDKLQVDKFLYGLNYNIIYKVMTLILHIFHKAFQRAMISILKELVGSG
jgi:hypothetical protein